MASGPLPRRERRLATGGGLRFLIGDLEQRRGKGAHVIVWQDSWYAPHASNRLLHIYLPDWYHDTNERFPVMYFFDGHNLFFDDHATYGRSWRLERFLRRWEKPMIVVGLECSHKDNERLSEYNPYNRRILGRRMEGLGEETFSWIIQDVKPAIDAQFRTWEHREATGIAGASMGGLMSLYGVMCHNAVFGKAAALSTGIRFSRRNLLRDLGTATVSPDTRVYLSWGEREAGRLYEHEGAPGDPAWDSAEARATHDVADALEERGAAVMTRFVPGGRHREADWERQVPGFMDFLWLDRSW